MLDFRTSGAGRIWKSLFESGLVEEVWKSFLVAAVRLLTLLQSFCNQQPFVFKLDMSFANVTLMTFHQRAADQVINESLLTISGIINYLSQVEAETFLQGTQGN
jgi:hypothetical protein